MTVNGMEDVYASVDIGEVNKEPGGVSVTLVREQKGGPLLVQVAVRSRLKKNGIMYGRLDLREFSSKKDIRHKVEVLAGALAERIAERFKDPLMNPDYCAKEAGKGWDGLLRMRKEEALPE